MLPSLAISLHCVLDNELAAQRALAAVNEVRTSPMDRKD